MGKNVYSVVLEDDVVAAVDLAAMRAGTNRSAMMNRLLAAQLECATAEDRVCTVLDAMQQLAASHCAALQVASRQAQTQLALRSVLRYKYNPTQHYSLELFAHPQGYLGALRCQLRTQNTVLVQALGAFYQLWAALEQAAMGTLPGMYQLGGARFTRLLRLPPAPCGEQALAQALTRYVACLDDGVKLYCEHLDDPALAQALVEQQFPGLLQACGDWL